MKSTLLAVVVLLTAVLDSPCRSSNTKPRNSNPSLPVVSKTQSSKAAQPTAINAPLMDWIKNESTDLQWYTTIFVGTPPQEL